MMRCRVCGCTDTDCSGCVARTGQPCFWVVEDLCSACAPLEMLLEQALTWHRAGAPLAYVSRLATLAARLASAGAIETTPAPRHCVHWRNNGLCCGAVPGGPCDGLDTIGDCTAWCELATPNEATTGAGAAAGPAREHDGAIAQDGPWLGGLQTDPSHAAAGGAGISGAGHCSQEPTGLLRDVRNRVQDAQQSPLYDRPELRVRLWQRIREYVTAGSEPRARGTAIAAVERVVGELMAAAGRTRAPGRMPVGTAPDLLFALWGRVNEYVAATRTGRATDRHAPALAVEHAVFAIVQDACRRALSFASHEGWRRLARALGEPGLELEPELLVARVVETISVLEASKMPDDPELGALLRVAAGLPSELVTALRDVAEAAAGDIEASSVRAALQRFVALLQRLIWGRVLAEAIDHHVDDVVVVREVLSRSGFLIAVEHIAAWTTDQRLAALTWAAVGRLADPPSPPPAFLEQGGGR